MKKIKKKYNAAVIGTSFTSLLTAGVMSNHGAKILLLEKNPYFGGKFAPFKKKFNNKSVIFDNEFCGFSVDNKNYQRIFIDEFKFNDSNFIIPKNKLEIINEKTKISILNDKNGLINCVKNLYPLQKERWSAFICEISDCNQNPFLIKSIIIKYETAYKYLLNFFDTKTIDNIFVPLEIFVGLELSKCDVGYFIRIIINILYSRINYPKDGILSIINYILKIVKKNHGDYTINAEATTAIISKNKVSAIKIEQDKHKSVLNAPKYLVGMNYISFLNDILNLKGKYLTNYKKLYIKMASKTTKIKLYLYVENKGKTNKIFPAFLTILKNKLLSNVSLFSSLIINNYCYVNNDNNRIDNSLKIEFLINKKNIFKNEDILSNHNKLLEKMKKNILDILFKLYPTLPSLIKFAHIYDPLTDINNFNDVDLSYGGLTQNIQNNSSSRSMLTPFVNTYIASKYGSPGGHLSNIFESSYNLYHAFDINFKGYNFSLIDVLNYEELLNILQTKYKFFKKYNNKILGFYFDNEKSFLMQITKDKLIIKEAAFEETFSSDIYIYCNFATFKNILQKRTTITKEVLLNNFRVKGGVWLLKRILNKCNLLTLNEKELKKLDLNIKSFPLTSKRILEIKNGTKTGQF